jgi:hypothetical protein
MWGYRKKDYDYSILLLSYLLLCARLPNLVTFIEGEVGGADGAGALFADDDFGAAACFLMYGRHL